VSKIILGVIVAVFLSWMLSPMFQLIEVPAGVTALEKAEICMVNNSIKSNSVIFNIVTFSIESLLVEKIKGNTLFSEIEDCSEGLTEAELEKLNSSDARKAAIRNAQHFQQLLIDR
jgi:hypothetical protein